MRNLTLVSIYISCESVSSLVATCSVKTIRPRSSIFGIENFSLIPFILEEFGSSTTLHLFRKYLFNSINCLYSSQTRVHDISHHIVVRYEDKINVLSLYSSTQKRPGQMRPWLVINLLCIIFPAIFVTWMLAENEQMDWVRQKVDF